MYHMDEKISRSARGSRVSCLECDSKRRMKRGHMIRKYFEMYSTDFLAPT